MRVQQFACSLLVALLAARDVICSTDNNNGLYDNTPELQAMNVPLPDRETLGLFPRLSAKYWRGPGWAGVRDPALYMLTENEEQNMGKRNGPSLSIVNSLDVLRQRLLLEIARRQMRENVKQAEANRAYLKTVGKRTTFYGSQAIPAQPGHDLEEAFDN